MTDSLAITYRPEGRENNFDYKRVEHFLERHEKALESNATMPQTLLAYWRSYLDSVKADLTYIATAPDLVIFLEEALFDLEMYLASKGITFKEVLNDS